MAEEQRNLDKNLNAKFYGGTNNWRLPTVDELRFIVDYSKKNPAVFENFAPYVKADYKSTNRYRVARGVVIDRYTKLMWLQELAGYNDWRIPDMKEL